MFLTTATQPDIAYAVNRLSTYMANLMTAHYRATKQVLQYVMGSKHYGLTYKNSETHLQGKDIFYGFADAAYANADHYHFTLGYVFITSRGAII